MSFRRCIAYTEYAQILPFAMKIGDWPSGPPPRGRVVSLLANRAFPGTTGYSRKAVLVRFGICDRKEILTFIEKVFEISHLS
jgi:hypothetical protein